MFFLWFLAVVLPCDDALLDLSRLRYVRSGMTFLVPHVKIQKHKKVPKETFLDFARDAWKSTPRSSQLLAQIPR